MEIKIKYFSRDYPKLEKIEKGDWIDLRVDNIIKHKRHGSYTKWENISEWEEWHYAEDDILFIGLGVAMELPEGYEAVVAPRSSTFKNTGLILTNSIGVIDESYCGDTDEWKAVVYCTRDGEITRHDRLFQFRIQKSQPEVIFKEVKELGNEDRGGYGSTGRD